mmetsp:Transcript_40417/g.94969  ORF Transcript_40417/g.94969 Transcript_40417/m.94969 type:complete len:316 (-) Transcript_40417:100-1047(-)
MSFINVKTLLIFLFMTYYLYFTLSVLRSLHGAPSSDKNVPAAALNQSCVCHNHSVAAQNQTTVAENKDMASSPRIAFMIPSGRRPKDTFYATDTILGLKRSGLSSSSVLVFNTEGDGKFLELENMRNVTLVKEEFPVHWVVRPSGTIFATEPKWVSKRLPALKDNSYKVAGGDNTKRKLWRTKEAQDFMFVSKHALKLFPESEWFVFLQDDAVYVGHEDKIENIFDKILHEPEVVAQGIARLNPHGCVAFLIHRTLLMSFLGYAEIRFHLIPIDWLLFEFLAQVNGNKVKPYETNIFHHKGRVSSFEENGIRMET